MISDKTNRDKKDTSFVCDAIVSNLSLLQEKIDEFLEGIEISKTSATRLKMIAEEFFVNIASYAYPNGKGQVRVSMSLENDPPAVKITFRDRGIPYNPLEAQKPDVTLGAEERSIGGLGIYLSLKCADDVSYEYTGAENVLTFTKNL